MPFSATSRTKLRTSSSAPPRISLEHLDLLARVELRVLEHAAQLGHGLDRGDEVAELLVDDVEPLLLLGRVEERARVDAVGDGH